MDGFHLANVELQRLGRAGIKGAPDTFDSAGYAALLRRLRDQGADEIVYAPEFRREIEEPVAGAIAVLPGTRLVITEGNYLLLDSGHWAEIPPLLDDVWYVEVDDTLRTDRLTQRHRALRPQRRRGEEWVAGTDEPNARLIATTRAAGRGSSSAGTGPASRRTGDAAVGGRLAREKPLRQRAQILMDQVLVDLFLDDGGDLRAQRLAQMAEKTRVGGDAQFVEALLLQRLVQPVGEPVGESDRFAMSSSSPAEEVALPPVRRSPSPLRRP